MSIHEMFLEKQLKLEQENNNNPNKKIHYTPLGDVVDVRTGGKIGFTDTWNCEANNGVCEYNLEEDPACDTCIHCDEPMERK